jgi:hypothetical protein
MANFVKMTRFHHILLLYVLLLCLLFLSSALHAENNPIKSESAQDQSIYVGASTSFETIEWTDLIPKSDLDALLNPPEALSDIQDGSEDDVIGSQLRAAAGSNASADRYSQALVSTNIRPEFNNRNIRIPGFIVPLEFDDEETITSFFLVPFFGACIHVPPPPPNQIIYAEIERGIKLDALYSPFWISGKLSTELIENDMATAAYSVNVVSIEDYQD